MKAVEKIEKNSKPLNNKKENRNQKPISKFEFIFEIEKRKLKSKTKKENAK